jgi:alkylated DNA repair protein alkB family protein 7
MKYDMPATVQYLRRCTRFMSSKTSSTRLVNFKASPRDFIPSSAVVYENFLTDEEGHSLVQDIRAKMKRRRYEKGHWDAVITDYKEAELITEDEFLETSRIALEKTRQHLLKNHLTPDAKWLPCHAIDLKQDGELKAHVDSVRFSGDMVAGLSLLSTSIMRLRPGSDVGRDPEEGYVDMLLPPLSLYVMTGVSRYQYAHELLPTGSTFFAYDGTCTVVERQQRLSIIFRDAKSD